MGFFAPLFCARIEKQRYFPAEKSAFSGIHNGTYKIFMKIIIISLQSLQL